jgi:hypothetical protein
MSDVTFNIYGGNNQILPNATKAEQNFYGDQFAEKTLAKDGEAPQPLTEEEQALSIYINKGVTSKSVWIRHRSSLV